MSAKRTDAAGAIPRWLAFAFFVRRHRLPIRRVGGVLVAAWRAAGGACTWILRKLFFFSRTLGPPVGWFSACEPLRRGASDGRLILEQQEVLPAPPGGLMERNGLGQHLQLAGPIFWRRFSNARLAGPGLALLNERKEICLEAAYGLAHLKNDPGYSFAPLRGPTRLEGFWTSVISRWVPVNKPTNFAHWMLEALPRLAVLQDLPREVRILVPAQLLPFQEETLDWLGLRGRIRKTPETFVEVETCFFSSPPAVIVCPNPYGAKFLRTSFLTRAEPPPQAFRRFYVTRSVALRKASNEFEVQDFFKKRGWGIVDTATLPLAQQIGLFSEAEAVSGIHGAAFTNIVWSKPGTHLIELLADRYLNGCYEWLCQCVQANHHPLIFPTDHSLNAVVDLKKVERVLDHLGL